MKHCCLNFFGLFAYVPLQYQRKFRPHCNVVLSPSWPTIQTHNTYTSTYACRIIKMTSDTVLRKIYLSLYLKVLCVRGSWRLNRTATYWPPHSYGHQRFFLVLQGCSTRGPGAQLSAGCWLSLPHLVSKTGLVSKLVEFPVHWVI